MKIAEVMAPLAAAGVLMAGVGSEKTALAQEKTRAGEAGGQFEPSPMQESLNSFRNRVLMKHQARILMSACVAWPNISRGITVTWNPGVGEVPVNGENESYFIFSTHNKKYKPSWGPLNGPFLGSPEAMVLVFQPTRSIKGGLLRYLSTKEIRSKSGRSFYKDRQTGQPVMNS